MRKPMLIPQLIAQRLRLRQPVVLYTELGDHIVLRRADEVEHGHDEKRQFAAIEPILSL